MKLVESNNKKKVLGLCKYIPSTVSNHETNAPLLELATNGFNLATIHLVCKEAATCHELTIETCCHSKPRRVLKDTKIWRALEFCWRIRTFWNTFKKTICSGEQNRNEKRTLHWETSPRLLYIMLCVCNVNVTKMKTSFPYWLVRTMIDTEGNWIDVENIVLADTVGRVLE